MPTVSNIITDKSYDSDDFVALIESNDSNAIIPPRKNRNLLRGYDRFLYKDRHL